MSFNTKSPYGLANSRQVLRVCKEVTCTWRQRFLSIWDASQGCFWWWASSVCRWIPCGWEKTLPAWWVISESASRCRWWRDLRFRNIRLFSCPTPRGSFDPLGAISQKSICRGQLEDVMTFLAIWTFFIGQSQSLALLASPLILALLRPTTCWAQ